MIGMRELWILEEKQILDGFGLFLLGSGFYLVCELADQYELRY